MIQNYLCLLDALSDLVAKHNSLDAEDIELVPLSDLENALSALRESRRACHSLAAAVRGTQPTSDIEAAVRRDALVAYSALANPDDSILDGLSEFSIGAVRSLYPLAMLPSLGCQDPPQSFGK